MNEKTSSNFILSQSTLDRKPGFFVKIKEGENFNRRHTLRIPRIKI